MNKGIPVYDSDAVVPFYNSIQDRIGILKEKLRTDGEYTLED